MSKFVVVMGNDELLVLDEPGLVIDESPAGTLMLDVEIDGVFQVLHRFARGEWRSISWTDE